MDRPIHSSAGVTLTVITAPGEAQRVSVLNKLASGQVLEQSRGTCTQNISDVWTCYFQPSSPAFHDVPPNTTVSEYLRRRSNEVNEPMAASLASSLIAGAGLIPIEHHIMRSETEVMISEGQMIRCLLVNEIIFSFRRMESELSGLSYRPTTPTKFLMCIFEPFRSLDPQTTIEFIKMLSSLGSELQRLFLGSSFNIEIAFTSAVLSPTIGSMVHKMIIASADGGSVLYYGSPLDFCNRCGDSICFASFEDKVSSIFYEESTTGENSAATSTDGDATPISSSRNGERSDDHSAKHKLVVSTSKSAKNKSAYVMSWAESFRTIFNTIRTTNTIILCFSVVVQAVILGLLGRQASVSLLSQSPNDLIATSVFTSPEVQYFSHVASRLRETAFYTYFTEGHFQSPSDLIFSDDAGKPSISDMTKDLFEVLFIDDENLNSDGAATLWADPFMVFHRFGKCMQSSSWSLDILNDVDFVNSIFNVPPITAPRTRWTGDLGVSDTLDGANPQGGLRFDTDIDFALASPEVTVSSVSNLFSAVAHILIDYDYSPYTDICYPYIEAGGNSVGLSFYSCLLGYMLPLFLEPLSCMGIDLYGSRSLDTIAQLSSFVEKMNSGDHDMKANAVDEFVKLMDFSNFSNETEVETAQRRSLFIQFDITNFFWTRLNDFTGYIGASSVFSTIMELITDLSADMKMGLNLFYVVCMGGFSSFAAVLFYDSVRSYLMACHRNRHMSPTVAAVALIVQQLWLCAVMGLAFAFGFALSTAFPLSHICVMALGIFLLLACLSAYNLIITVWVSTESAFRMLPTLLVALVTFSGLFVRKSDFVLWWLFYISPYKHASELMQLFVFNPAQSGPSSLPNDAILAVLGTESRSIAVSVGSLVLIWAVVNIIFFFSYLVKASRA